MITSKKFYRGLLIGCLLLIGFQFGNESEQTGVDELDNLFPIAQELIPAHVTAEANPQSPGRGLASLPGPTLQPTHNHADCEAAREMHATIPDLEIPFSEEDAMAHFLANPKGQALMDEFLHTVETPEGERVLKIDVAQDFEQSLEHIDHTSASDSL